MPDIAIRGENCILSLRDAARSRAEGCILSRAEGCILSRAEGCILSRAEGRILSRVEGLSKLYPSVRLRAGHIGRAQGRHGAGVRHQGSDVRRRGAGA